MEIISRFVREQQRYTKNELSELFCFDETGVEHFIQTFKAYNILKSVRNTTSQKEMSDLTDADVEVADETAGNDAYLYVFAYVGILVFGNRVIGVYPKYLLHTDNIFSSMRQVMKVLEKYNDSIEQIINLINGVEGSKSFNLLSVMLYLIRDYYEYGTYKKSEMVLEINGEGDIQWQKTIDETFPIILKNRPIYTEIFTRKVNYDDDDFFGRLHRIVLTECFSRLEKAHLMDLFGLNPENLSEESLDELGDKNFILNRILQELNVQFDTRKQTLLKTLYSFIAESRKMKDNGFDISMFGTTSFNMVWEKICSRVFNNQLQFRLNSIELPKSLDKFQYSPKKKLIEIVEKPVWVAKDKEYMEPAKDTLIPDLITFVQHGKGKAMVILDAKYYNLHFEKNHLSGQPGIESITKQYLYQLAYQDFADRHGIREIRNCFILPTDGPNVVNKGHVELQMLKKLGLQDIEVRLLPADQIYDCYLANRQMDIQCLDLW